MRKNRKNKYIFCSKKSEAKFREFIWHFCLDISLTQLAKLINLNRNTVNKYVYHTRKVIAEQSFKEIGEKFHKKNIELYYNNEKFLNAIIKSESEKFNLYIFSHEGKIFSSFLSNLDSNETNSLFGIKENNWAMLKLNNFTQKSLQNFIRNEKILENYSNFIGNNKEKENIVSFFLQLKRRLTKFYGISPKFLYFHFKETEIRYNNNIKETYLKILRIIREKPIVLKNYKTSYRLEIFNARLSTIVIYVSIQGDYNVVYLLQ